MKPKVYLGGPITGLAYRDCTDWREYATAYLARYGIQGVSPMRGKSYLAGEGAIAAEYVSHAMSTPRAITGRDRYDCKTANAIIYYVAGAKDVTKGTLIEMGWGDRPDCLKILVIDEDNIHEHPIVRQIADFTVADLDEALRIAVVCLAQEGVTAHV